MLPDERQKERVQRETPPMLGAVLSETTSAKKSPLAVLR